MTSGVPQARGDLPAEAFDFEFDPARAAERKRARLIQLNTWTIPELRLVGFALLAAGALFHNAFILHDLSWLPWMRLAVALIAYAAVTWYLLYLFYADLLPYLNLGTVFLAGDLAMMAAVISFTGAERSWIFLLPLVRVADQTPVSFRRALAFAHLAPLAYAAVIVHAVLVQGRAIPVAPEAAKLLFIYAGSVYIALVARPGDVRHRRTAKVIRFARSLIRELERNAGALESSSAQLHRALDQQAQLAEDNARLYANAEAREARLEQILQSTSDGIIFVAPGGRIETANVRAGDLFGFDPEAVIGQEVSVILGRLYSVGDGDAFLTTLNRLLNDPGPGASGDLQQPATGRVFHWVAQATRDTTGGAIGLTFTFHDVTPTRDLVRQLEDKSRLLEEARRRAEDANCAKGEFLANVTHELRTPLSAIAGMTQVLLDGSPPAPQAEGLKRIKTSAESLLVIIADILDLSKIDSRKLTLERAPMALGDVLDDVVDTVRVSAGQKGLALETEVAPDVPNGLVGDALRLRQVLLNLLGNAIKFTESGEVRIRVGVASRLPAEVCLHFAVLDTGVGIPRGKQELVFEAFAQADGSSHRRYGGTGLGLSISARLVELMGGDIWVESEVGRGSAFRFTAQFGLPTARGAEPAPVARAGRLTVLVVEDDQVHRELLTHLLLARGHRVITARNGREGLIELARHPVQLVLLDLQMPEMDGFQMAIAIREWERSSGGHVPLIAMTASLIAEDVDRSTGAGIDELLTKPIARERLYTAVESLAMDRATAPPPPELAGRAAFLEGLGNDVDLARRLVDVFFAQSSTLLSDLSRAIAESDADLLRRAAHTLKGSVSNFPAGGARDAASRMELVGFDGDFDTAREVLPILEKEIERLKSLLPALI